MQNTLDSTPSYPAEGRLYLPGLILLCVLGAALSYWISVRVFHQAPMTTDENSYIFQANNFLSGRIARDAPPYYRAFAQEMVIIHREAGWLSRYPPAHSVWLIPGVVLGDPYLMSALASALTIFMIAMTCRRIGVSPYIGAILALCCPYFLFTNGTLLSHTSGMLAVSLMIYGYLHWRESQKVAFALLAGLAWGWLYMSRTYTAFCICIPFGIDALVLLARHRTVKRLSGVVVFAGAAMAGVVALSAYNAAAVGDPFAMTYLFYDSSDGLGFGPRHIHSTTPQFHTLRLGLKYYAENVGNLDAWMFGFRGSLTLAVIVALIGRSSRTPLLLAAPVAVWAGYILFWYPGVNVAGPTYYAESVPFILVAACPGIARLIGALRLPTTARRGVAIAGATLLFLAASSFSVRAAREIEPSFERLSKILQAVRSAPPRSMVFINVMAHGKYIVHNPHGLEGDPLVVSSKSRLNEAVARHFSDRETFVLHEGDGAPWIDPIDFTSTFRFGMRGASAHRHTGMNHEHRGFVQRIALRDRHEEGYMVFGVRAELFPGRFTCRFGLEVRNCDAGETAVIVDVVSKRDGAVHARREVRGNVDRQLVELEFEVDAFTSVEPRVYYAGHGDVAVAWIKMAEADSEPPAPATPKPSNP